MSALIPPRSLVVPYLAASHISLACAFALTAWNPHAVAGFFYHSRIVAIVHLVTIGWIGMSILGNVYIVLPLACGRACPARRGDYTAYGFVVIGLIGMVAHFWIGEFGGMAWSAATAALGILYVTARVALAMRQAKVAGGVKLHLYFAAANVLGAVSLGVLLAFDKVYPFLPGYVLANVFAHAHLAAVGWACMTLMGFGYRLLPMVLPAAMPSGTGIYASAITLEVGILGLFIALVTRSGTTAIFALTIVAAFMIFGGHVLWMLGHTRRPPYGRSQSDFALHHLAAAGVSLLLACVCGVFLAVLPMSEATMRVALLYGVLGLVGFLAQAIIGFDRRILPTAAAYWMLQQSGGVWAGPVRASTAASGLTFALWLCGVPLVAAGLFINSPATLASGAALLFAGTLVMSAQVIVLIRQKRHDREARSVVSASATSSS